MVIKLDNKLAFSKLKNIKKKYLLIKKSDENHIKDLIYFITSLNIQYIKYLKEKCLSRKYFSCLHFIIRYKLNVSDNICPTAAYKTVLFFTNCSL